MDTAEDGTAGPVGTAEGFVDQHITLPMLAAAFLAVTAHHEQEHNENGPNSPESATDFLGLQRNQATMGHLYPLRPS